MEDSLSFRVPYRGWFVHIPNLKERFCLCCSSLHVCRCVHVCLSVCIEFDGVDRHDLITDGQSQGCGKAVREEVV